MSFQSIPAHEFDRDCEYLKTDTGCYYCCDSCNYNTHICHGCGSDLSHLGNEVAEVVRGDDNVTTVIWTSHEGCTD